VRPAITSAGSRRAHLAGALLQRQEPGLRPLPEGLRQRGILDGQRRHTGGLQLLDRAHHVQRVAVAVVGIDHERQLTRPRDPPALVGEFRQRQHDEIRRPEHRQRGGRAAKHADLVAQVLGDPGREGVEDRGRDDAPVGLDIGAEALAAGGEGHVGASLC